MESSELEKEREEYKFRLGEFRDYIMTFYKGGENQQVIDFLNWVDTEFPKTCDLRFKNILLEMQLKEINRSSAPEIKSVTLEEIKFDNLELEERVELLESALERTERNIIRAKKRLKVLSQRSVENGDFDTEKDRTEMHGHQVRELRGLIRSITKAKNENKKLKGACEKRSDGLNEYFERIKNEKALLEEEIMELEKTLYGKKSRIKENSKRLV